MALVRDISLALFLFGLWFALSGETEPFFIAAGVGSSLFVALITARLGILDPESVPLQFGLRFMGYWLWLFGEIVKSNFTVARLVLFPSRIDPCIVRFAASQSSDIGRVIFANSITLTPGTLSIEIEGNAILVHALTRAMGDPQGAAEMDRRVTALETPQTMEA